MGSKLEIKLKNMNDEIIRKIMKIDETFYHEDLSFQYYKERYSEENEAYCLYDGNNMVGYVTCYGIKKSLYEDLKKGKYDNDYEFDINLLDDDSKYVYISSMIILDEYRKSGYGIKLLDKVLEKKNKIYVAMAISNGGFHLLSKRMNLVKRVTEEVSIFELVND